MRYVCKRCHHICHAGPEPCDKLAYHGNVSPDPCGCFHCGCFTCAKNPNQLEFPPSAYTPTDAKGVRVY